MVGMCRDQHVGMQDSACGNLPPLYSTPPALEEAVSCLGDRKVISAQDAAALWGTEVEGAPPICFERETVKHCADGNNRLLNDWRLVYLNGFSLLELRERIGTDRSRQPCFSKSTWWTGPDEAGWTAVQYPRGYYLIDTRGRFYPKMSWLDQETEVRKLGQGLKRVPEALLAECMVSFFLARGERLLEGWYHWGPSQAKRGRVHIGDFREEGLEVGALSQKWRMNGTLRVCLARQRNI